jgi:S-adenosylmethionine decarboxylase proenzyme
MSVNAAAVRENGVGRHRATTRPHAATVLVSDAGDDGPSFDVVLPRRWMTWSLLVASVFAFFVGRVCRLMLLQDVVLLRSMTTHASSLAATPVATLNRPIDSSRSALPLPVLSRNKPVPSTVYTSKHFDTSLTAKSDTILLSRAPACRDDADEVEDPTSNARTVSLLGGGERIENHSFGSFSINLDGTPVLTTLKEPHVGAEKESAHEPTGQHLLVDIENVDSEFLNSEARLADAMVTLIKVSGLTLLSYHCHGLEPTGVSCVGVLLESHVSFHTWPAEGVITLDLFTCGGRSLLPLVGYIEDLFGVPSADDSFADAPRAQWALKNRGFPHDEDLKNPEDIDLDEYLLGWIDFEMKEEVASVETDFQSIEVFDVINPRFRRLQSHKRSLTNDGSYEAQHPELFLPDRVVYLDKIMQSRRYGEKEYHEALVHPAMFAHRHPKRVAIIGGMNRERICRLFCPVDFSPTCNCLGGEGATLREVLKHKTVENVTMIEIDEVMVQVSRKVLPEWSSCIDFGDGLESCFDDPRATVYYADAISWFINVFGDERSFDDDLKFDVIIMDALYVE